MQSKIDKITEMSETLNNETSQILEEMSDVEEALRAAEVNIKVWVHIGDDIMFGFTEMDAFGYQEKQWGLAIKDREKSIYLTMMSNDPYPITCYSREIIIKAYKYLTRLVDEIYKRLEKETDLLMDSE